MVVSKILKETLVLVPTFNEGDNLEETLIKLIKIFPNIILIDDGSSDNSVVNLKSEGVQFIRHTTNLGQGKSIETGCIFFINSKKYKYLITFDSDGQHQAEDALNMLQHAFKKNLDFVLGSRFINKNNKDIPLLKKLILKLGIIFENYRSKLSLTDAHNGLRVLNLEAVKCILPIKCSKMAHASEIVYKLGRSKLKGSEYPVNIIYKGKKSQSPLNFVKILFEIYLNEYLR